VGGRPPRADGAAEEKDEDDVTAIALTIAGSDSGGGAGIQADLKTFSALGVYGASVITALTAQNTRGVSGIHDVPADFVAAQLEAVFSDLAVGAVKTGMLSQPAVIEVVADALAGRDAPVVVDPVMVAASGDRLISEAAIETLRERLLPLAALITPNLPEAATLLETAVAADPQAMIGQAEALAALGPRAVLLKGGHGSSERSDDLFLEAGRAPVWLRAERHPTKNTHGTGCTLASAVAAGLAQGMQLAAAAERAKRYVTAAIVAADGLAIGHGYGPVHHFHAIW
jgi:hydroxymethylpyrimidine/phosphomethylpyrimidine kinase